MALFGYKIFVMLTEQPNNVYLFTDSPMNLYMLLWAVILVIVICYWKHLWITFRLWWITSKCGEVEYRLKIRFIHYKIQSRVLLYRLHLRLRYGWHKVRVFWFKTQINFGYFNAEYPHFNPPKLPFGPENRR